MDPTTRPVYQSLSILLHPGLRRGSAQSHTAGWTTSVFTVPELGDTWRAVRDTRNVHSNDGAGCCQTSFGRGSNPSHLVSNPLGHFQPGHGTASAETFHRPHNHHVYRLRPVTATISATPCTAISIFRARSESPHHERAVSTSLCLQNT